MTVSGIAVDRAGPIGGAPIVLVHAGIADRRMWQPQWAALSSSRDTVRMDLRGFGESATPPAGPLSHFQDVTETMDQLGVAGCHMVGCSLGSGAAVEVALTRPDLVQSLLLCPPGGSLLAELTPDLQRFIDAEEAALDREDLTAPVAANIEAWVVGAGRSEGDVDAGVLAAVRTMQRHAFEVMAAWGDVEEDELDPPALERLGQLAVPTTVLVGGHDLDTTHDAAARICSGAPSARRVDWPDVAHLPSMERPTEFLALLREWVAGE